MFQGTLCGCSSLLDPSHSGFPITENGPSRFFYLILRGSCPLVSYDCASGSGGLAYISFPKEPTTEGYLWNFIANWWSHRRRVIIRCHNYENTWSSWTQEFNLSLVILLLGLWSTTVFLTVSIRLIFLSLSLFSNLGCPGLPFRNTQFCLTLLWGAIHYLDSPT